MRVHVRVAAAGLVAAISLIPGTAGAADEAAAHDEPSLSEPIASGLVGPLQLAAGGPGGSVWVAQGFEYHRGRLYVSYDVFGDGNVAVVEGVG